MQSVTIEKGQHITLTVLEVEPVPSKNPSWDSRWKVSGVARGGVEVSTYLGNKALTQQLTRLGKQAPEDLLDGEWTFERTVEGYLNVLSSSGKAKTQHVPLAGAATPPAPEKRMPFDEPAPDEAAADRATQARDERRLRVSDDIAWAVSVADNHIAQIAKARNIPYGADLMRSVVALAATIHISCKDAR